MAANACAIDLRARADKQGSDIDALFEAINPAYTQADVRQIAHRAATLAETTAAARGLVSDMLELANLPRGTAEVGDLAQLKTLGRKLGLADDASNLDSIRFALSALPREKAMDLLSEFAGQFNRPRIRHIINKPMSDAFQTIMAASRKGSPETHAAAIAKLYQSRLLKSYIGDSSVIPEKVGDIVSENMAKLFEDIHKLPADEAVAAKEKVYNALRNFAKTAGVKNSDRLIRTNTANPTEALTRVLGAVNPQFRREAVEKQMINYARQLNLGDITAYIDNVDMRGLARHLENVLDGTSNVKYEQADIRGGAEAIREWVGDTGTKLSADEVREAVKDLYRAAEEGLEPTTVAGKALHKMREAAKNLAESSMVSRPRQKLMDNFQPVLDRAKVAKAGLQGWGDFLRKHNLIPEYSPEGLAVRGNIDAERDFINESWAFHATQRAILSSPTPERFAYLSLDARTFEQWDNLNKAFGFENADLAANIISAELRKVRGLLDDAAALETLGPSYRKIAQELAQFLESDNTFFLRQFNVGAARSLRRLTGITPEGVVGDTRSAKVLDELDRVSKGGNDGELARKAIRRETNSRAAAAVLSNVSAPVRAALLSRSPLLFATDAGFRGGLAVNNTKFGGQFRGATYDSARSFAKWARIWRKEIAKDLKGTDEEFHGLQRASQSALQAARIEVSRFGEYTTASVRANKTAAVFSRVTGHAAQNYASSLAAREAVLGQASSYARSGRSLQDISGGDLGARAFYDEVGRYITEDAWAKFREFGGDLNKFAMAARKDHAVQRLYEQLDRSLLQRAKAVGGEGISRNRFAFSDPSQTGSFTNEALSVALVFTRYTANISITYAQRIAALWRQAGDPTISDWKRSWIVGQIAMQSMGIMFTIGAMTIYTRDYLLRNRDLDPDDEAEMSRFIGKSIAYSNMFGILGDILGSIIGARNEEAAVADIVRGRVPGIFVAKDMIDFGLGMTVDPAMSAAFSEEGFDFEEWKKNSRNLVRNFIPKPFYTAAVANYVADTQTRADEQAFIFPLLGDRLTQGQRPVGQQYRPKQATIESFSRLLSDPNLRSENW